MKRYRPFIVGAVGGAFVFAVLLLSGVINVASSTGRTIVGDWLFATMVRQSVTLRSAGISVPPLDDPRMIRRGAGHYELVCAACHGSTIRAPDAFAETLEPEPPRLTAQMAHWRPPGRVYWTVQHGIRYSAMPAWATQKRPDEVWDMVAFLEALPGLSAAEYAQLTGESAGACTRCHTDGDGGAPDPAFPRLDIQSPQYLADALSAFRSGTRVSGTMHTVARHLRDAEIRALAAYHGKSVTAAGGGGEAGAKIARAGIPERNVPACESCHGDSARADYPRLAGQSADYIARQLTLFRELGTERGGRFAHIMAEAAAGLSNDDIKAVAEWYGIGAAPTPAAKSGH